MNLIQVQTQTKPLINVRLDNNKLSEKRPTFEQIFAIAAEQAVNKAFATITKSSTLVKRTMFIDLFVGNDWQTFNNFVEKEVRAIKTMECKPIFGGTAVKVIFTYEEK